ncbi:gpW family head-tail joining protein [Pokkaliibacter sp. CJK22405]|uniref:gpW family head-tail joining protein n=1 Tax=Pokkaliibacter sp. CJK22405 TaxID=3384615 RepID=UPI00398506F6
MATEAELAAAKLAYSNLITGRQVVQIQRDGRTINFQPAEASILKSYIESLERELGLMGRRRRPLMGVR